MRALRLILGLIGFTAVIAQIVLMRELLVLFSGNEISLGLMLASWLLWTALGSGVLGRLEAKSGRPARLVAALELLIAAVLPVTILATRAGKSAFQTAPGQIFGPGVMLIASLAVLAPFCLLSGWLFAAGSRLCRAAAGASTAAASGTVYVLEALGSAAGGVLASVVLIRYLDVLQISFLLALLNILAAAWLLVPRVIWRLAGMALVSAAFAALLVPLTAARLERTSVARLWQPFRIVATANSVYGNLVLAGREGSTTLYENGLAVATLPDPEAAEEAVHYALLQHPAPERLLLIGGGMNGSLAEALKHSILRRIDYVELDPAILELMREHLPAALPRDPRVRVRNIDGRLYLKTTRETFDVIIVNLPDPATAQLNRFYTVEFFQEAGRKLRPGGVFSFQLTSSENYIGPELGAFLRCVYQTLRIAFRDVTFLPGGTVHFFASNTGGVLLSRPRQFVERLRSRSIDTSYVREYYIPFRMSRDRMTQLASELRPRADTPVNRDFAPVAYYFDAVLWSARFNPGSAVWLRRMETVGFVRILALAALASLVLLLLLRRPRAAVGFSVAVMGTAMIGLEILLLLGFQAIYGYVYHQLAILIAMFMAGMAAGSWLALRGTNESSRVDWQRLAWLQGMAAAAPPLLCWILAGLGGSLISPAFGLLAFLCGLLGGGQFPLASRLFFAGAEGGVRGPGALYALDLAGSCLGAVVFSAWLIPLFGFWKTSLLISVLCLASLLLVFLRAPRSPGP
jgi:spermidine synthase